MTRFLTKTSEMQGNIANLDVDKDFTDSFDLNLDFLVIKDAFWLIFDDFSAYVHRPHCAYFRPQTVQYRYCPLFPAYNMIFRVFGRP